MVVTGTWTSVREQMADRYAARLAARGFMTLAFDHTGYGASGGRVRDYESPALKTPSHVRDVRRRPLRPRLCSSEPCDVLGGPPWFTPVRSPLLYGWLYDSAALGRFPGVAGTALPRLVPVSEGGLWATHGLGRAKPDLRYEES